MSNDYETYETHVKKIVNEINSVFERNTTINALKTELSLGKMENLFMDDEELLTIYKNSTRFTKLINGVILPYVLRKIDSPLEFSNEYYRIDLIGYINGRNDIDSEDAKKGKRLGLTPYCWSFRYAVEHENERGKWIDEALKLSYVNCPYRIIIGYNRPIRKNEEQKTFDESCLDYLIKCIEKSGGKPCDSNNTKLLVLFGVRNGKQWTKIKYDGYIVDYSKKTISHI